jgi:hypothetical protein
MINTLPDGSQTRRETPIPMVIDPLTGAATYDARIRRFNVTNLTHIEMQARSIATGAIEASVLFDIRPFRNCFIPELIHPKAAALNGAAATAYPTVLLTQVKGCDTSPASRLECVMNSRDKSAAHPKKIRV